MDLLKYSLLTHSTFSPAAAYHAFKIRAVPQENVFQHIMTQTVQVTPASPLLSALDAWGNSLLYGSLSCLHDSFEWESKGVVAVAPYLLPDAHPSDLYLFPTPLTVWDDDIQNFAAGRSAEDIMHAVHAHLSYQRFCSDNTTPATTVFRLRKGVCQDYAHLMIAACRSAHLMARYVNGLTLGEGETHAWVEVYNGHAWQGYDPTEDRPITTGYLKIAHGRDVGDCPTNRGRLYQYTAETMTVKASLQWVDTL